MRRMVRPNMHSRNQKGINFYKIFSTIQDEINNFLKLEYMFFGAF